MTVAYILKKLFKWHLFMKEGITDISNATDASIF